MTHGLVLNVSAPDLPIGDHIVEFIGVRKTQRLGFPSGLEWEFVATEGPFQGASYRRPTGEKISSGKAAFDLLEGMLCHPPIGKVDTDPLLGRKYRLRLQERKTEDGRAFPAFDSIAPLE